MDDGDNVVVCYKAKSAKTTKEEKQHKNQLPCPKESACDVDCPYKKSAKTTKDKKSHKDQVPCPKESACDVDCPNRKRNKQEHKKDKKPNKEKESKRSKIEVKKPSKKPKNFCDISKTASANCCTCCQVFAEYLTEAAKLICCMTNGQSPGQDGKLGQLFCTMMQLIGALGQDAVNLVKMMCHCVFKLI